LRRGELAIREARSLARVPLEQQVVRWQAAQDKKNDVGKHNGTPDKRSASPSKIIANALSEFHSKPQLLAGALRAHLGPDGVKTLLAVLAEEPATV
jgi:ParB family chromosome partitioning protein